MLSDRPGRVGTARLGRGAALAVLLSISAVIAADTDWKFDVIYARNGAAFRGMIVEETPSAVRFQNVRRRPGYPTVVFSTSFARPEILRIERLADADRATLKARLKQIDPSGHAERRSMEQIELETIPWNGRADAGRRYRSEFFTLESDAPDGIVRRTAVRLDQIYAAYARYLPPRVEEGGIPTEVVLLRSRAEYEARLRALGLRFVNVAYYEPTANRIVCVSDLDQLGEDLERVRQKHLQLRQELDRNEATLLKLYRGSKDLARHVQPIRDTRQRIEQADRRNEELFDQATRQLFAVLYHEAFHAYLTGRVYSSPGPEPPRWLNEGLAQVFETAIVEAGELRVGHADRDRLTRAKDAARKDDLVPLEQLLTAEAAQFQAAHAGDRSATGKYYLTAWAVAFHLAFERRLMGTPALDEFVRTGAGAGDLRTAFAGLVGCPVEQYERELKRYLAALQPDGTTGGPPGR